MEAAIAELFDQRGSGFCRDVRGFCHDSDDRWDLLGTGRRLRTSPKGRPEGGRGRCYLRDD